MKPRRSLLRAALVVLSALPATVIDIAARTQPAGFCGSETAGAARERDPNSIQLKPRDEGVRRPDFAEFRRRLQDAVARQDVEAVATLTDPAIRLDFGGGAGIEMFKASLRDPAQNLWAELATVLALGGRFRTPDDFDAPYVYADWPESFDAFECGAITGTGVRLRAAPRPGARIVAVLNHAIVKVESKQPETAGWRRVRPVSGPAGFVASSYVRSSIDHRAIFTFKRGRWWLTAFVAGD